MRKGLRNGMLASGALLRVDDSGTTVARVRMYETMSDIDTGTNPAPTDAKVNGGLYWWKSDAASAAISPGRAARAGSLPRICRR